MADGNYLDNDIVLKVSAFGAATELFKLAIQEELPPAILALARFTLRSRIQKSKTLTDKSRATSGVEFILKNARQLEPSADEIASAADLEQAAAELNLSLDAGESQLIAMLISREAVSLFTGDKRAALAISIVLPNLVARLMCLEQVIFALVVKVGLEPLRSVVCDERATDKAVTNCFQCASENLDPEAVLSALQSYIEALRHETNKLLVSC